MFEPEDQREIRNFAQDFLKLLFRTFYDLFQFIFRFIKDGVKIVFSPRR